MITQQPEDVTVAVGDTATFTVEASGTGLTYQWYTSSNNGETWTTTGLNGNKTATLSFEVPSWYDGRLYKCKVKDQAGNTVETRAAKLTLIAD